MRQSLVLELFHVPCPYRIPVAYLSGVCLDPSLLDPPSSRLLRDTCFSTAFYCTVFDRQRSIWLAFQPFRPCWTPCICSSFLAPGPARAPLTTLRPWGREQEAETRSTTRCDPLARISTSRAQGDHRGVCLACSHIAHTLKEGLHLACPPYISLCTCPICPHTSLLSLPSSFCGRIYTTALTRSVHCCYSHTYNKRSAVQFCGSVRTCFPLSQPQAPHRHPLLLADTVAPRPSAALLVSLLTA